MRKRNRNLELGIAIHSDTGENYYIQADERSEFFIQLENGRDVSLHSVEFQEEYYISE